MSGSSVQSTDKGVRAVRQFEVVDSRMSCYSLKGKCYHLIGIGGVGMSALARVLMANGAEVSGSDQYEGDAVQSLASQGAVIFVGHEEDNLPETLDTVVYSAAIKPDNPEFLAAMTRECTVVKYARMLGDLMDRYKPVAVCGTHGKSTTSAWLSYLLKQAGEDVNFVVGAKLPQLNSSSGVGTSPYFVAEACEYDRSFLNIRPDIVCLLNIEADHLDYYKDETEIVNAFIEFAAGMTRGGTLVANGQDANVERVVHHCRPDVRCVTYGLDSTCDVYADRLTLNKGVYHFDVMYEGRRLGSTHATLPGLHNVMNALGVITTAMTMGVEVEPILTKLPDFEGIERRMMLKGCSRGVTVLDDYAHHPTEIRATLAAIQERFEPRRLWCVFQPHQYSRTRFLLDDFAESFKLAYLTIVPEIYFVRDSEATKQAVNAQVLVDRLAGQGSKAVFIEGFTEICEYLVARVEPGDVVVTMGAGDIWKVADEYIQRFGRDS
ncbi:MAG: UDP-N-acetylmuramate--L-alanine ligase [Planctomycetes bacterium]|nr:UDP-N-acetylmuramate--L-alanine ligase [Planctomycetota bacterium]